MRSAPTTDAPSTRPRPVGKRTLIGEPKEIYEFWEHQLKPKGYRIRFQILDYPGGMPGDVVVTLSWQTEQADQK